MMKAVIVEAKGKYAVALNKNGEFIKLKNKSNYKLGYEVDISSTVSFNSHAFMKVASIAAAFILVVGLGFGGYAYASPYSYIDVDINPSIEITSNIFNRIIDIKALNKEGEKLIASGNYKNKSISDGIGKLLKSALDNGYLKAGQENQKTPDENADNAVMLTVSCKNNNDAEKIKKSVSDIAAAELDSEKVQSKVISENTTLQTHNKAKKAGISSGKMMLIEKLKKQDSAVKEEDFKDSSVKDIIKEIDKAAGDDANSNENNGKGNGHGDKKNKNRDNSEDININENGINTGSGDENSQNTNNTVNQNDNGQNNKDMQKDHGQKNKDKQKNKSKKNKDKQKGNNRQNKDMSKDDAQQNSDSQKDSRIQNIDKSNKDNTDEGVHNRNE